MKNRGEFTKETKKWLENIRKEEINRFGIQFSRLEPLFNYGMLSASILYGFGALRAVDLRDDPTLCLSWLGILTIGSIFLILGFTSTMAYEYQWFDLIRVRLHLIHDFYDSQIMQEEPVKIFFTKDEIEKNYWKKRFIKELKKNNFEGLDKIFCGCKTSNVSSFKTFNWIEALTRLRTNEKPLMDHRVALARQFNEGKRNLVVYTLVALFPLLSASLGVLNWMIAIILFLIFIMIFSRIQKRINNFPGSDEER